jgi:transposase
VDGAIYVFRAKRADRLKLLFWDGSGVCLFAKRLEENAFCWPRIEDGVMRLTSAQLSALLEGLDWKHVRPAKEVRYHVATTTGHRFVRDARAVILPSDCCWQ